MRGAYRFLLIAALCAGLAGCGSSTAANSPVPPLPQSMPVSPPPGSGMLTANIYAGDALSSMLLLRIGSGSSIVAASFVELDNLDQTSGFGRLASQQIGSRIGQHGFRVLEVRMGAELRMDIRQGEFLLTRDSARLLTSEYDAFAALVGVYSSVGDKLFVSARVVRLSDNALLGAYEYYLPMDGDVRQLLAANSGGRGGDAVWSHFGRREQAFDHGSGAVGTSTAPRAASRTGSHAANSGSAAGTAPAASPGRAIDPSAAPMPFPGGRR